MPNLDKKILLLILDGWGLSPSWGGNAISMNNPKHLNDLWRSYPHKILRAYDRSISKTGYIGNSEIGHTAISAGKFIMPNLDYINAHIADQSFTDNRVLKLAAENCRKHDSALHLIGMISDAGIHSHLDHLYALLRFAKGENLSKVYVHAITDGRDTGPTDAIVYTNKIVEEMARIGVGEIATVTGRYYAMDKGNHYDRINLAYKAIVQGVGDIGIEARQVVSRAYEKGYTDEYIPPTVIVKNKQATCRINDFDSVIMFNHRADRMQELCAAIIGKFKTGWGFKRLYNLFTVTLTDYFFQEYNYDYKVAFKRPEIVPNLAQILSENNFKQFHVAESEKSSHVTYFFDGGKLTAYPGEDWKIVPSPNLNDFTKAPQLSAAAVTDQIIGAVKGGKYQFIVANYANVDVLGHSGDIRATSQAVEAVDAEVGKLYDVCHQMDWAIIITADHGNAEQMIRVTDSSPDKEIVHTINPVPFILVDGEPKNYSFRNISGDNMLSDILRSDGTLADIAPTILQMYGLPVPPQMEGSSLLERLE